MRNGVALVITLFFVIAITTLLETSFYFTNKALDKADEKKIFFQLNQSVKDLYKMLETALADVKDKSDFRLFMENVSNIQFPMQENSYLYVEVKATATKIPINLIANNNNYYNLLKDLLDDKFNLTSSELFLNMLLDTLDTDNKEREYASEIVLKDRFFRQGEIYSLAHLNKVVEHYVKESDDRKIYQINWEDWVSIHQKKAIILCEQMPTELKNHIDSSMSCDDEENTNFTTYGICDYDKENCSTTLEVNIELVQGKPLAEASFLYDANQTVRELETKIY